MFVHIRIFFINTSDQKYIFIYLFISLSTMYVTLDVINAVITLQFFPWVEAFLDHCIPYTRCYNCHDTLFLRILLLHKLNRKYLVNAYA